MGTCNFYTKNTNGIYRLEIADEWEYEDAIDNVRYGLNKLKYYSMDDFDNDRSHPGRYIAHKLESIDFPIYFNNGYEGMASFHLEIMPIIRSGYYADANLDFDFELKNETENHFIDDVNEDLREMVFAELLGIMYRNRWHFFNDEEIEELDVMEFVDVIDNMINSEYAELADEIAQKINEWMHGHFDELEKVFSNYCDDELITLGRFSNGEAIYQQKTNQMEDTK